MKEEPVTDALLRQFLLGQVDDEQRQRIEGLFITDRLSRERVEAAEEELIDDYLDDCLAPADRESFLLRYANTPQLQRKIRIAQSIREWAMKNAVVTPVAPPVISIWSRLRERLWVKPALIIPIAATLIVGILIAGIWLNNRREQNRQHLAVEQELRRLNTPASLNETPSKMPLLTLTPVSLRSIEAQPELITGVDTQLVELRLRWIQKERYPTYRAVVHRLSDNQSFTIPDLRGDGEGNLIRVRLRADIFTRGSYRVELTGVVADGTSGITEEYRFVVN